MMKTNHCLAILAFSFLIQTPLFAETISLKDALKKGYLQIAVTGLGGYSGECIKLKMENLTRKSLEVQVDAGQIFEPVDSSLQNLMVSKEETFLVEKGKTRIGRLYGFCVEAGDGSPGESSGFILGKMADGNLLQFAQYLSQQNQHKNNYAQYAVWAVSDEERLEGIGDPDLAKYVANLLGKPVPEYHVKYQQPDQSRMLPGIPATEQRQALSMNGIFYYNLESEQIVNFELYNEEGEKIHAFFENRKQLRGYHKFRFEFMISNLPKGKYIAKLVSNGQVIKELAMES